jgi:PAS domain S-box-containing protein
MLEINVRTLRKTHSTISTTRLTPYQPPVPQMVSFFRKLLGVGAPAETKSHENQADLQLMMDNSVDVILRVGPDLLQRYVSPSSLQLFGLTPQEMIGLPAERFVLPEDHHVIAASVARLHAGETGVTARVRILRKDGAKVGSRRSPAYSVTLSRANRATLSSSSAMSRNKRILKTNFPSVPGRIMASSSPP